MATSAAAAGDDLDKKKDRMERFRALHLKRNEARKMNLEASKEEERIQKLPANFQSKRRRVEWEVEDEAARKAAEEGGDDYDRQKLLDCGADEVVRIERKRKKQNPDPGFSTYEDATIRQYQRLTKQMQPDIEGYTAAKEKLGDAMYPDADALPSREQDVVSKEGVDRMVEDLDKQIKKREKFSRRRAFHDEADVNYINERNMRFNRKAERFYGKYTAEIKQNLERGTAV